MPGLAILPFLAGIVTEERKQILRGDAFFDVRPDADGGCSPWRTLVAIDWTWNDA